MCKDGCLLVNWSSTQKKLNLLSLALRLSVKKISSHFLVSILGSLLHPVDSVRNLGVWFDAEFSFSEHVKRTCNACFLQMRDLRRIRQYLTPKVAVLAANALVSSRLDYCNSLFRGLSCFNLHKLQSIQNTLARIVTNHRRYAHVTPILKQLHWLPIKYRCMFKTATLIYKFLHSGSPSYFQPFLSLSSCSYSTRLSHPDRQYLTVPPFRSSVFKSVKHLITALPLMLLRSGMNSLMMCAVQHQLPPSERSLKHTCLQKHTPHSLSRHPVFHWYDLAMSLD